jgi:hypothetical protein
MNNFKANQRLANVSSYSFTSTPSPDTRLASKVLSSFFSSVHALASKPVYNVSGNKVVINIFYYISDTRGNKALSSSAINSVGQVLSKLFKRPVELRLVRLHYPYLDSYILAQYIAINTAKYNFTRIVSRLWGANAIFTPVSGPKSSEQDLQLISDNSQVIPAYITGIKVRVSGRLVTERSVPRQTVKTVQLGTFSGSSGVQVIDSASFTSKNKKGAFTIKVWIGQSSLNATGSKPANS